ncbi:F-box protein CPR1-like [Papaver somniferum]|uniref:F-box protein CPR1-like n=1 Tax=Papaver somniferum TaxID=3469 RepID=UPI000E6F8AE9|nr:F-box protein CPR1-like [Papaver somniferum]
MELPFIKSLTRNYPQQRTFTHGSCNGLILMENCTAKGSHINLCVWNPTTKVYKEIGKKFKKDSTPVKYGYGLGYNCDTDDYKIVRANLVYGDDTNNNGWICTGSRVQVYTLRSGLWKELPNIFPYNIYSYQDAFVNGALHWIALPCPGSAVELSSSLIVSFHIKGENFGEVPHPPHFNERFGFGPFGISLHVLGGCLCMVFSDPYNTEVWVMKDHKVRDSWTRLFIAKIPVEKTVKHFSMKLKWEFKNGKVLFEARSGDDAYFLIYDHYKSEVSKIYHIPEWRSSIETYVESLVSIPGTSEGEQEYPSLRKQAVRPVQKNKKAARKYHLVEKVCITNDREQHYIMPRKVTRKHMHKTCISRDMMSVNQADLPVLVKVLPRPNSYYDHV